PDRILLGHRAETAAEKALVDLLEGECHAMLGQQRLQAAAAQGLAVHDHTVAIEDDEIEVGQRPPSRADRAQTRTYAQHAGNCALRQGEGGTATRIARPETSG